MKYIVYDATGKILRTGQCPDRDFKAQAGPGEFVMEGTACDLSDYVENGKCKRRARPLKVTIPRNSQGPHLSRKEIEAATSLDDIKAILARFARDP